ncbi:MAG: AraC family transcriptional regulator [Pseudomonadota bacterium]
MKDDVRGAGWTADAETFHALTGSCHLRSHACFRANLGALRTNVARVVGAPPGYYEHPPYDGISIFMSLSRAVGRVDVGEGLCDMAVQSGDFVVGVPGAAGRMDSYRGGHWMHVVLSQEALRVAAETRVAEVWNFRRLHKVFHRDTTIRNLITKLVDGALATKVQEPLRIDTAALSLLEALAKFADACDRRQREVAPLDAPTLARIDDFMDAHLSEKVTLESLAGVAGMQRPRFIKAFRNSGGKAPYQHLLTKRLEAARASIMESSSSLTEIAFDCGFSSHQHMTGLFSERFGISPFDFRKQVERCEIVERRSVVP